MLTCSTLTIPNLHAAYETGSLGLETVLETVHARATASPTVYLAVPPLQDILARCKELQDQPASQRGKLWGIPFAVKDNIDVAGYPTTCACPDFAYTPTQHAPCVAQLLAAGGIFLGKTNMDQFACGLVGTRTPYGVPPNAFDDRFTPGGSSCGSAVAVAAAMVTFALGTDTAGSGRVPAGLNGIIGIKPTVGRISTHGVVPACYALDCVSVFALTVEDGATVVEVMQNANIADATYKQPDPISLAKRLQTPVSFRFAVPSAEFLAFDGPGGKLVQTAMEQQFASAIARLESLGGQQVDVDFAPFAETAALLYGAPFVAERYAGIWDFLEAGSRKPTTQGAIADLLPDERLLKVIRAIISRTSRYSAADVFAGFQRLTQLQALARVELQKFDVLVVPTAAYNYTVQEIKEEEATPSLQEMLVSLPPKNANLGRFTNFVNLLNMCGVSVYSGVMDIDHEIPSNGDANDAAFARRMQHLQATGSASVKLPFGITLLASAWTDSYVAEIAAVFAMATGLTAGPEGHGVK